MNPLIFFLSLSAIGFASGLRSFTPLALVAWVALWGWMPLGGSRLAFIGTVAGAIAVSFLAMAELIGDKLPITPSRLSPGPLGARIVTSGLAVSAICVGLGRNLMLGILCGVLSAVAGAFCGFHARRALVNHFRVRDWIVAILEDLTTIGLVLVAFAFLF
jgi:uncharacterized membrane protein